MADKAEDKVANGATEASEALVDASTDDSKGEKGPEAQDIKEEQEIKAEQDVKEEQHEKNGERREIRDIKDYSKRRNTRTEFKNNRKNVKTDYEALSETDDADEIRKQVEFYFSDSNLIYDDHMRSLVLGNRDDKYGENYSVSIKTLHSFKRMRRFQPYSAVVKALKESKTLEVVGDKEDEVRRKERFEKPETQEGEFDDPTIPRSIYAKGFGEEGRTTQFDIEAFFTPYGPINSVRLRRNFPQRVFKGSVFVEFETEELQKEFLELDPKPKFEGHELLIMSKQEYCDQKLKDIKSGKIQPNNRGMNFKYYYRDNERNGDYRGRGRGRGHNRGGRGGKDRRDRDRGGDRDRDDWRNRRDDFQKNGFRDQRRRRYSDSESDRSNREYRRRSPSRDRERDEAQAGAESPSKKRSREDDADEAVKEASETKKIKPDEATEAA